MSRRRSAGKARSLARAVGLSLVVAAVPFALLLREDEAASTPEVLSRGAPASEEVPAPRVTPKAADGGTSSGVELAPPPPGARREKPPAPRPAPPAQEEAKKDAPPASVRLVALRKLERKRPEETVDGAEALVRDTAADPAARSVMLGALGILNRVSGGEAALVRLSQDPPTEEVGKLATDYLMRPR